MRNLKKLKESFSIKHENIDDLLAKQENNDNQKYMDVKILCNEEIRISIEEYFPNGSIIEKEDGSFILQLHVPENEIGWKMNTIEEIKDSIAYCGLICKMCHLSSACDGCKSDFGCEEWKDCVHRTCCIEKNINGCWECEEAPCDKKMFSNGHDIRIRAFINFMKEESPKKLVECIVENEKRGFKYGYQKDYDLKESEEEVIALLIEGDASIDIK